MRVRRVHVRDLPVPVERVGALIGGLGGPADRLWPSERWPTTPLELDGPLAIGTAGRQGLFRLTQMRQVVANYEPGRRVAFRFTPGVGVVGTRTLDARPLDGNRTRLVHTLDARVQSSMLPIYPMLIRQHDALVQDLLDRAELETTGRVARPARWPLSVRLANAVELAIARRRGLLPRAGVTPRADRAVRIAGVVVPVVLGTVAALHAAWAVGWWVPAGSERELAELVLSSGERARLDGSMPPAWITWLVGLGLAGAAALTRRVATGSRSSAVRRATWGVAAIFLTRGLVYPPLDLAGGLEDSYDSLDLALYSPLCLAIAIATTLVLLGTTPATPAPAVVRVTAAAVARTGRAG